MQKYEIGIDTLSYYYGLTMKQKRAIVSKLMLLPDFFKKKITGMKPVSTIATTFSAKV